MKLNVNEFLITGSIIRPKFYWCLDILVFDYQKNKQNKTDFLLDVTYFRKVEFGGGS